MAQAIRAILVAALFAAPAIGHGKDTAPPPTQAVTNPQAGATYTTQRLGTLAEGYEAQLVTLKDVAILKVGIRTRGKDGNQVRVPAGSILVREDESWFCSQSFSGEEDDLTRGIVCYADMDNDGRFERRRLKRSRSVSKFRQGQGLAYELRASHTQLRPVEGLKRVLVFDGYSKGKVKLRRIEFLLRPSKPETVERLRIELPDGSGPMQVDDLEFYVDSVSQDRITLRRLRGNL
ncbi:MAG: hypothetical protein AAFQ27_10660 [Pseudomonadota bacterium]